MGARIAPRPSRLPFPVISAPRTLVPLSSATELSRVEDGLRLPLLVWAPGPGWLMLSSAILGGGWGERHWVMNAQVPPGYRRHDPDRHLEALARGARLGGPGAAFMTAARVGAHGYAHDGEAEALVTAGVGVHGWAASPEPAGDGPPPAGTINIIVALPVPLSPAAYVNAVATATEAKVQALRDAGVDASGTPTDAVCVAAPHPRPGQSYEVFTGPRSTWGARLARAVHRAAYDACVRDLRARGAAGCGADVNAAVRRGG
ncbi:adenosylcobinamide amidohydrolase [Streptomyces sp. NPDC058701]|uniref:adenosylcobinamide amidohydrolase n=1 Tax=Streptomyces sp. NPDC058701 TaxID=3346608 RepID=UPI00365382C5